MKTLSAAAVVAALAATAPIAHAADRLANPDERAAIGAVLQQAGYTKWSKIELDDGKWEVDNAVRGDGKVFDVDLALADLTILKEDEAHSAGRRIARFCLPAFLPITCD